MANEATDLCLDCHSPMRPVRRRQLQMFAWSVLLGIVAPVGGNLLGVWESEQHVALYTIAALLFFGSLWWPEQCRVCDGSRIIPIESPAAKRYAAELFERAAADASRTGT
ncbi:MAG TPA: hypothetical protein VFJ25_09165 [Casimicrobiaceae bacterium]|nr:hypothetical protein [Casimicrobiaceae bacterium]